MTYNPREVEKKWQKKWQDSNEFEPKSDFSLPKKYILSMLPYPSGSLHMGHVRNYSIGDAIARYYRKAGFNVLHPIGWDSFGLPAENAAIKHNLHPKTWTYENIANMQKSLKSLGFSFSQTREFSTSDPIYTKWEQQFFTQMWDKGLVYRKKAYLNWCPNDNTVLANEQVIDGKCWRCDTPVVQKEMYQYYLKITDYADELLEDLNTLQDKWPNQVITMQKNWIGKSTGLEFSLKLESLFGDIHSLEVFTTRADTIYGVTYCAIAPEHSLAMYLINNNLIDQTKIDTIKSMQNMMFKDRVSREKEGVSLGIYAIHPLTNERLEIFVANFVLMDYGSGAVMCVPAHDERDFEFAKKYNLPIKKVINNDSDRAFCDDGILINSDKFNGLSGAKAREAIIEHFSRLNIGKKVVNFKLKDWGISRQRYWGSPIPLIHCEACGIVKEVNLPVLLPDDVKFNGEGNPLFLHSSWKYTKCPKCNKDAIRECDTMDTFMESSWYFLRYTTPRDMWEDSAFSDKDLKYWLNVDEYIGGIEHAILHLLYARFFTKVLRDLSYLNIDEPFERLLTQGMVLKNGFKMSKSKGNVVDPKEIIETYGADTARLFILFAAPPVKELEWNDNALEGAYRFINKIFSNASKVKEKNFNNLKFDHLTKDEKYARKKIYKALLKYEYTFSNSEYPFNTLIASCMEAFNALCAQENEDVWYEGYYILLNILEPIIPHTSFELSDKLFNCENLSVLRVDHSALQSDTINIAITINGKKRTELEVANNLSKEEVLNLAKDRVQKWLDQKEIIKEIVVPNKLVNFVIK